MIGRADSAHSNYTQLGQGGRARTLSGPAHHRGMSGGGGGTPVDRSSFPPGRPSPAASPHLVTPEEEEGATAADSEAAAEDQQQQQQQLGLSEWNAFPGYSVVTTGGEPAPAPRMNGYVPALPLMPPISMGGGSQVRLKRLSHGID